MQDGYFRVLPDGQILTINPAAVRILGYENADEMVGRVSVVELYADSTDRDAVLAALRKHGEITGYEVDLKRKDGAVVRVELTVAGVLDAGGNLIAQDGTLRDVTERHRQAQELERSQQQVQSLVQNVPGAIYRYQEQDGAWVCTFMSDAIRTTWLRTRSRSGATPEASGPCRCRPSRRKSNRSGSNSSSRASRRSPRS